MKGNYTNILYKFEIIYDCNSGLVEKGRGQRKRLFPYQTYLKIKINYFIYFHIKP